MRTDDRDRDKEQPINQYMYIAQCSVEEEKLQVPFNKYVFEKSTVTG